MKKNTLFLVLSLCVLLTSCGFSKNTGQNGENSKNIEEGTGLIDESSVTTRSDAEFVNTTKLGDDNQVPSVTGQRK